MRELTLYQILISAFLIGLSGAMVPGPVLSVAITEASKRGAVAGPLIVLGHGILELLIVFAFFLGFSQFAASPVLLKAVAVVGGGVLLWMGGAMTINAIRRPVSLQVSAASPEKRKRGMPILLGAVTTVSTPYWHIWWLTVGLAYFLQSSKYGKIGVSLFFAGHILADLVWYSLVSFTIAFSRRFLSNRVYKGLLLASSLFLVGMGIYFIWLGAAMSRI